MIWPGGSFRIWSVQFDDMTPTWKSGVRENERERERQRETGRETE